MVEVVSRGRKGVVDAMLRGMQIGHGIQLAYCTNIHRGESWAETLANLELHTMAVRERVAPAGPMPSACG
jgi:hypothetical protein